MKQELICEEEQNQLEFQDILGIGMTLVVTVIGLSMGADVTGDIQDDQTANSLEYNITGQGLTGLSRLSVKLPTIMTVMTIAIIIGVLVRHLYIRYQ